MEGMREIGAFLEGERKRQQLSLKTVSEHTRISIKMLRAIEEGELEVIGTPLLIRSFLKTYCEALGIDPRPILEEYGSEIHQYDDEGARMQRFARWMKGPKAKGRTLVVLLVIFIVAAALTAGWALWWPKYQQKKRAEMRLSPGETVLPPSDLPKDLMKGKEPLTTESIPKAETVEKKEESPASAPTESSVSQPPPVKVTKLEEEALRPNREEPAILPMESHSGPETAGNTPSPAIQGSEPAVSPEGRDSRQLSSLEKESGETPVSATAKDEAAPTPVVSSPTDAVEESESGAAEDHVLRIVAEEEAWVQVLVDGKTAQSRLMKSGQEETYRPKEFVRLWVGNAGGIRVFWDGVPLKPLGKRGEVIRVRLPDPTYLPQETKQERRP